MKAAIINEFGDINELKVVSDYPEPFLRDDEVLISASATSINPIDFKARQGMLQGMFDWQFPVVLGWDVAGEVVKVGKNITKFFVGDRVFARPDIDSTGRFGSYAELVAVKEDKVAYVPRNLTDTEAAAVPLAGETALQMLKELAIAPGKKVLIQAGAGGVGIFAIQIAKIMGGIVATTVSEENIEFAKRLGADLVIDYHKDNIQDVLSDYDAVLDSIGAIDDEIKILKPGGKIVTISSQITAVQKQKAQNEQKSLLSGWLNPNGNDLTVLAQYIEAGKIKIFIDSEYRLTTQGIQEAHKKSESHHARGKIVIAIN